MAIAVAVASAPAVAAENAPRISLQDSFRLGDASGVPCRVQAQAAGPALKGMFDRGYVIVCRDAATAVGRLYALRGDAPALMARLTALRGTDIACRPAEPAQAGGLDGATVAECGPGAAGVGYRVYALRQGRILYVAEGLSGYDSALTLGLRTLIADRIVPGAVSAATTAVANPAAFARVQAGTLDLNAALAEGYRRNNSGSYAEAAEFFDTLLTRDGGSPAMLGEYVANRALQRSNLGDFAEGDALFAELDRIPTGDPIQLRLRRNFRALHLLNQQRAKDALAVLAAPVAPIASARPARVDAAATPTIDRVTSAELNSRAGGADLGLDPANLTSEERGAILDAQARQLRGVALRLTGDLDGAEAAQTQAEAALLAVRGGRVSSITRLRAQVTSERGAIREARGDLAAAETLYGQALAQIEAEYPRSAAANGQKARLAAFYARTKRPDLAITRYREVVQDATAAGASTTGLANLLAPYFDLLAREIAAGRTTLTTDFFAASETLVRPGVADTQAVLARELSGGSDDAARLFRQSVNLTREVERVRIEAARLTALAEPTADEATRLATVRAQLTGLESDQVATQAKLSAFPRYRALSTTAMTLPDLQAALRPDEAYWKLAVVGQDVYAVYATAKDATAYRTALASAALDGMVDALRDTIVKEENGQILTFPYDLAAARKLYVALAGPVADRLAGARAIIFEPDGAMLRLPINLLVTDDASVAAYAARRAKPGADEFDLRGTAWLGRKADISTAVSARAFRDTRAVAPSSAKRDYLGFGQNLPVSNVTEVAATRSLSGKGAIDCNWPLSEWNKPISAKELFTAERIVAGGRRDDAQVVTEGAFSDTAVMGRTDLNQYRILHFATHGLVTAPRPECPARPALLTSFGDKASDGLLSFREIYDLKLDADLVILSACDTAGKATVAATREAGVTSGGGSALDGLVRSFIGAGGRSIVASHWPAPDDFGATGRLITGLFDAKAGTSVAEALRLAEVSLMDQAETSHPYYWSGFAIVGDGSRPVLRAK